VPNLPLAGVRVVDLTMWFAGPMASRLLADMGAEVIKIESLNHIDPWRGPVKVDATLKHRFAYIIESERPYNCSAGFNLQNRNKYGLTLDLGTPEGKDIFKRLVKISDIVLENYSPRVMRKLGLDYSVLKEINPQIIMMSLPALGTSGPERDYIAFGQTIDCMSGMAYLTGYIGEEPMLQSGLSYGDPLAGMNAAFACLCALRYRRRNQRGMHIELSQVEGVIAFNADAVMDYTMNGRIRGRMGNRDYFMAPHGCYRCRGEDRWVAIAIPSDSAWQSFCQIVKEPWIEDERFSHCLGRYQHQDELDRLIEAWTLQYDHYKVMNVLQQVGIPAGPVLDAKELVEEPHLNQRGFFVTVTHREAGTHPYIGMYARFSKTPGSIRMPAPCLGEHNHYVLGQLLGMSQDEIAQLEEKGIIGRDPSPEQQGGMF